MHQQYAEHTLANTGHDPATTPRGPLHRLSGVVYTDAERSAFYLDAGIWEHQTLGDKLRSVARQVPDRTAFVCDGRRMCFGELDAKSEAAAIGLRNLGLQLQDRAMFQMGTSIETAVALFACFKAGIIPVCSIPQYRDVEIGKLAELTRPSAYFVQAEAGGRFDLVSFAAMMSQRHGIPHLIVAGAGSSTIPASVTLEGLSQGTAGATLQDALDEFSCEDVAVFQLSGGSTGGAKSDSPFPWRVPGSSTFLVQPL